jgi:CheY-like chemotaxis protein
VTTVLVVDDEPTLLAVVADVLREEGYTVVVAGGGRAALASFTDAPPDLVVLDVMMPGMDGHAAYRALRALPGGAAVPVVFASAAADANGLPNGAAAFLRKPYDLEALLALIARLVGPPIPSSR